MTPREWAEKICVVILGHSNSMYAEDVSAVVQRVIAEEREACAKTASIDACGFPCGHDICAVRRIAAESIRARSSK